MGKHRERHNEYDYEDDYVQAFLNEIYFDLDDDHEGRFHKKTRNKSKRARNARRRIEEYREERDLAARLSEYYDYDE